MSDEKIIMYSTGCPKCMVLETKLNIANIKFEKVLDTNYMLKLGIDEVPVLDVNGTRMNFKESVNWINNQKN